MPAIRFASRPQPEVRRRRRAFPLVLAVVFLVALAARLVPVLRGGGLYGSDTYDDGVHFAAALALIHGRWPYADFLLLHPPGIVLALTPFAGLSGLTSDGFGFAVARVAWMVLGSITAVLVSRLLRPLGLLAAAAGGLCYALYLPAIRAERTTMLEGLTSLLLVVALLLVSRDRTPPSRAALVAAGVLLGVSSATKIWGVVVLVVVLGWVLRRAGRRAALRVGAGAGLGAAVVCLPFFLTAPQAMWRMVVLDQLGRPEGTARFTERLAMVAGLLPEPLDPWLVTSATGLVVVALLLATRSPWSIAPLLVAVMAGVLFAAPSFYPHYPAALAVPLGLSVGSAVAVAHGWLAARVRGLAVAAAAVAGVVVALAAAPVLTVTAGQALPRAELSGLLAGREGCVTSDDPTTLIESDVFSRNLRRGCRAVVDLSGYSYDLTRGLDVSRSQNLVFQQFALDYLASGEWTVVTRFHRGWGYSGQTVREIARWPVVEEAGTYRLRRPESFGPG